MLFYFDNECVIKLYFQGIGSRNDFRRYCHFVPRNENALYTQHLLDSPSFEFEICILQALNMPLLRCTNVFFQGRRHKLTILSLFTHNFGAIYLIDYTCFILGLVTRRYRKFPFLHTYDDLKLTALEFTPLLFQLL